MKTIGVRQLKNEATQIYTHVSQARQAQVSAAAWEKLAEQALEGPRRRRTKSA